MLYLPSDWKAYTKGWIVTHLLAEARNEPQAAQVGRHLVSASLQLLTHANVRRMRAAIRIEPVGEFEWRIRDTILQYIHIVNDDTVEQIVTELTSGSDFYFIVRPRHERLLRCAVREAKPRAPWYAVGLDTFVDLRTAFTSVDLGWSRERMTRQLVQEFNTSATASLADESILITLPD